MALQGKDRYYMTRALQLAERGMFTSQPNPRVGCVIVRDSGVVGEGYHAWAGGPHAEVMALRTAGVDAQGASAYVTLEPCSHFGRTPPCADALIEAGIKRVVIACRDPNPHVNGRGIERLRAAGIEVETEVMEAEARELNIGFFSRFERQRPWVRVKLAMSLDGRTALANGESKWITGEIARADVQYLRARSSAILTGSGTVLADNPHLTVRLEEDFTPPVRVVLDRACRTPANFHVLDDQAPTWWVHAADAVPSFVPADNVVLIPVEPQQARIALVPLMQTLAERGVNEVHVEAGPTLCGALFAAGLVDEMLLYIAPVLLGDKARPLLHLPLLEDMRQRWEMIPVSQASLGDDVRLQLRSHICP